MPDAEVGKIAEWAWRKRCENSLYANRDSEFRVPRAAMDRLKGKPGAEDAIALYAVLLDLHGHTPGKTFALSYKGMREACHVTMSERRFLSARRLLEDVSLLEVAESAIRGTRHQAFQLLRPVDELIARVTAGEREEEGF